MGEPKLVGNYLCRHLKELGGGQNLTGNSNVGVLGKRCSAKLVYNLTTLIEELCIT